MFKDLIERLFAPTGEKIMKKMKPLISEINGIEDRMVAMSDDELANQTVLFKKKISEGASLNDILPEAFATVREVSKRVMNMRHYDVQLLGGYVLHSGKISEMKTGEGKTLVATLPMYLNALSGNGAHLVTVNDYLARRDAQWMSPIYLTLGMSVSIIQNDKSVQVVWDDKEKGTTKLENISRKQAYECDILYGTNNEFGFDYLRDNMKFDNSEYAQRELNFAIVDEVDSILIDEARTPLIISGPTDETTDRYTKVNDVVKLLTIETHYTVDEKRRSATLTDAGIDFVEEKFGIENIFDMSNVDMLHYINNALKAHAVFKVDVDYVVQNGNIIIVDEFTGRLMDGRRYSDGLHQAIEAKECVQVQNENQTYASITFQNYFRMYKKLSGMTGTALTEANEFKTIYGLEVVPIPTHRKMVRIDNPDLVYKTAQEKYEAIAEEIVRLNKKGQPVLVGTVSIEKSELVSKFLTKYKIKHEVLNAKNHEREAEIVANAGVKGAVTIATNMAGRGTDIKLGEGVEELGGLFILGTERHESRRIDNQLRGRSGRQGDSGESRFFLSMQDDLMRIFGTEKMMGAMDRLGMKEGDPIESRLVSGAIENAQKKVEASHFEVRKHLLEYDNVANSQRKVIYELRREILKGDDLEGILRQYANDTVNALIEDFVIDTMADRAEGAEAFQRIFGAEANFNDFNAKDTSGAFDELMAIYEKQIEERKQVFGNHFPDFLKYILISILDTRWKHHLLQMDHLRDSVGLRGYGQKDPLTEYKKEAYAVFVLLLGNISKEVIRIIMHAQLRERSAEEVAAENADKLRKLGSQNKQLNEGNTTKQAEQKAQPMKRTAPKVGRNDPCPCGSGKKYKACHGQQA